jgi:6-phosphogluconolactonase
MGNDGHTASFFPGGDTLDAALTAEGPGPCHSRPRRRRGPGDLHPAAPFADRWPSTSHIEGAEKADVLDKALGEGAVEDMPVRAVLRSGAPISVYWAP